ncbi:MAG TPA: trypsin-like peptidase domain-containing protein [Thermoleophilaceae bacterium]|nr:trypsin-like peptidase domain-containing protein [Thermoleophilaceae bacterium]
MTVQNTKVEVVGGGSAQGFNPAAIYKRYSPGVVTVISVLPGGGGGIFGGGGGSGGEEALGSGFVVDASGDIATNAHVVTSGDRNHITRASQVYVEFPDHNRVPAKIVGEDPNADVALLKVSTSGLKLVPLPMGSSANLVVGSPVAAIGSPFGEQQSLSVGVISATGRSITSLTSFDINNAIQTDAAINHGNSGGPLLNAKGQVIGINSQIKSTGGGGEGVGFAVPVNTVRRSIGQLKSNGKVEYSFLGVSSVPLYPQLAKRLGIDATTGALIAKVEPGSPAARAGLKPGNRTITFEGDSAIPQGGDAIVAVDGKPVHDSNDLGNFVGERNPGTKVKLSVVNGHSQRTVTVTLAPRPASAAP